MADQYTAHIEAIARHLLGDPNERLSKGHELRFGTNGSLSIDLDKGTFYDHEHSKGGGVLDLICHAAPSIHSRKEAASWLEETGIRTCDGNSLGSDLNMHLQKHKKSHLTFPAKPSPASPKVLPSGNPQPPTPSRLVAAYDYRDEAGALVFQVLRYEPKKFMQRRPEGSGWVYKVQGIVRILPYRLPELLAQPTAPVYVVEGEKDADRLAALGLVATCNAGGAGKWKEEHSQFLQDRAVIILPDNDEAGTKHAKQVARSLSGTASSVLVLPLPGLDPKGDVSDWLDAGGSAELLQELAQQAGSAPSADSPPEGTRRSQTDMLVSFIRERFALMHDSNGDTYAQDLETGEVRRTTSRQFSDTVAARFFQAQSLAVRDSAWREALNTVQALARFEGEAQPVHVRVAGQDGEYWVDLCQPGNSSAVNISATGWQVVDKPPVLFVRSDAMQPLPTPTKGANLDGLWCIANVPEDMRPLVLAWLLDSMRPDTPYPGLELVGEAGSGKSTTAQALRRLIDPNSCNLRAAPKATEDIFVSAGANHMVAYENISHLPAPMQDALCILSTGGGFAKRQLFTDGEEHVISVQRPWMVNSIAVCVTQQDLIDRAISVDCPVITSRQSSHQQWAAFEAALPGLLGALYSLMAQALAQLPRISLPSENRPRLVDYVLLGMAMEQASGNDARAFLATFNEARIETISRALDASPVATAVMDFLDSNPSGIHATMKEIFKRLGDFKPLGAEAWPRTSKGLGDALRRAAPALRQLGIECKSQGKKGGTIKWVIKIIPHIPENSPTPETKGKPLEKPVEVTV